MDIVYLLVLILAFMAEVSPKYNTRNLLKKIGLTLIMVSATLSLAHKPNALMEIGILFYFSANLVGAYFGCRHRRYYDKVANG